MDQHVPIVILINSPTPTLSAKPATKAVRPATERTLTTVSPASWTTDLSTMSAPYAPMEPPQMELGPANNAPQPTAFNALTTTFVRSATVHTPSLMTNNAVMHAQI